MLICLNSIAQTTALDWYNQGTSKGLSEDYSGAIDCFSKALSIQPDFEDALFNRGVCLFRKRQYKTALEDFNVLLTKTLKVLVPIINED